jgi:hypothetical protein
MILRVLRTSKSTLSRTFTLDGVATSATGSVVVTVTRLDGTVVESGNASGPDASLAYSYTFSGRDVVDELIVTWSGTFGGDLITYDQDRIEVVGGFFFSIDEGRAVDASLASTAKFPYAFLVDKRTETEDECERICGQAFVPRFRRVTVNGTGSSNLMMPDPMIRNIRSVKVGATTFNPTDTALVGFSDAGMIYLSQGWIPGVPIGLKNITIEYEHGWDRPPTDIVRGAKIRFKSLALYGRSQLPDRAERMVTVDQQGGTVVYGSPSTEKVGIPEVDAAYGRFPPPRPGFG